jgi:hypothetical protein
MLMFPLGGLHGKHALQRGIWLSWCQATIRARDQFFFLFEMFFTQLRVCYFLAPSLTRGRVCNLLCCWSSPAQSRGSQGHILLPQFLRLPQPGGPGPCIYIPQEHGSPHILPGNGFPFRRLLRLAGIR